MTQQSRLRARILKRGVSLLVAGTMLSGCADFTYRRQGPESAPIIQGPAVSNNSTLLEPVYACYRDLVHAADVKRGGTGPLEISVGEVRDYTGKSSINEGANVTQGSTLMVMSALGRLDPVVRLHERFDPRVAELELIYGDKRQLGDGRPYAVPAGPQGQLQRVPWTPYLGGTIMSSRYYIVGGITELNWNVNSGGIAAKVNQIGPTIRTYNASVGIDLRIVDTKSLVVLHAVTLQKQVTGHEVDANVFSFFGNRLFDISTGTKNDEPIQLAIRTTLELGVLELLASVSGVSAEPCLASAVDAGIVSTSYKASVPMATPSPQAPFGPAPMQPESPILTPPPAPRAAMRGVAPAPTVAAPIAPRSPDAARPDASMRPALPSYLQGPQMLPPPGSLSSQPGGASPTPAPMFTPQTDPAPDPQKQSTPGTAPASSNILGGSTPASPAASGKIADPSPAPSPAPSAAPAGPVQTLGSNSSGRASPDGSLLSNLRLAASDAATPGPDTAAAKSSGGVLLTMLGSL